MVWHTARSSVLLGTEFLETGATDPHWYRSHPRSRPGKPLIPNSSVSLDKFLDPRGRSYAIYFVKAEILSNFFLMGPYYILLEKVY